MPGGTKNTEMELQDQFTAASEKVKGLTSRPSNEDLLSLYGLFKQATEGDVHGDKPGMFDFKAAAKYNYWEQLKGVSKEDAMGKYVALVDQLVAKHS
jgi:diazepam-binding inhibitor (GABA receptor modulating acyl-CoA-binding protein)